VSDATILSARDLRVELRSKRGSFVLTVDELDLCAREALVIVGPNGSGKSTLMRAMAGLEPPSGGKVTSVATGPVTMVFQRPAPLAGSVAHNIRVVFLGKNLAGAELRGRIGEALERFKIDHLAEHRAVTLSGGELRRLALARAFALRPAVLLLDEPFAGLDADGQAALSLDLRRAISDTGVAVAMVTHAVLEQPSTPEIAHVVGMTNLVQGVVIDERRDDLALVEVDAEHRVAARTDCAPGTRVWIGIRPEHLKLDVGRGAVDPIGKGVVREVVNDGVSVTVQVDWAGAELRTHLMAGRGLARTLRAGVSVSLSASPKHVHLIPVTPGI